MSRLRLTSTATRPEHSWLVQRLISIFLLAGAPAERNRKNGLHARPHPGPLPQERGRRSRRLWKPTRPGVGAASERKGSNATDATEAIELSNSARQFSLSPGERAGVRANLLLTLSFSPGECHIEQREFKTAEHLHRVLAFDLIVAWRGLAGAVGSSAGALTRDSKSMCHCHGYAPRSRLASRQNPGVTW